MMKKDEKDKKNEKEEYREYQESERKKISILYTDRGSKTKQRMEIGR